MFICQMKIHKYTPKNDILLHHDTKKEKSQGGFVMNINTQNLVSITDANQNFSKATRLVDKNGSVIILKNNVPRYLVMGI